MQKFSGPRPHDEFIKLANDAGFFVNDTLYRERGHDHIQVLFSFSGITGKLLLSTWNGKFFGTLDSGEEFTESSDNLDNTGWYQELLNMVYLPLVQ